MIENSKLVEILAGLNKRESIKDCLFVIYGQLDQMIVSSAVKIIERKLSLLKYPPNIITKAKVMAVEILQNIIKHEVNNNMQNSYFILGTNGPLLNILSGNIVSERAGKIISDKLDEYVNINKESLREYYRNAFKNSSLTSDGRAGLGLLEIVYRSDQNIKYNLQSINNGYFSFDLDIIINQ